MYPEGFFINPEGTKHLSFKKDAMNPNNEGFIESWSISEQYMQLIFKKRLSKSKALYQWDHLLKLGWKLVDPELRDS